MQSGARPHWFIDKISSCSPDLQAGLVDLLEAALLLNVKTVEVVLRWLCVTCTGMSLVLDVIMRVIDMTDYAISGKSKTMKA